MRISTLTVLGVAAVLSTAACTVNPAPMMSPTPVVVQSAPAPMPPPPVATVLVPRTY